MLKTLFGIGVYKIKIQRKENANGRNMERYKRI